MTADGRSLAGRAAVVTGAAAGIGQGLSVALARAGADVAGVDIGDQEETRRRVEEIGGRFLPLAADITDPVARTINVDGGKAKH